MRMTPIKIGPAGKIGKAFAPTGAPPDFLAEPIFIGGPHAKENISVLFVASYGEA